LGGRFRTAGREEKGLAHLVVLLTGHEGDGSAAGEEDLAAQQDRRRHEPDRGEGHARALPSSAATGLVTGEGPDEYMSQIGGGTRARPGGFHCRPAGLHDHDSGGDRRRRDSAMAQRR